MKEKLTRNIGLKVLSIILAAILWLVITNVDDPVKTKGWRNVPVKVLNEEAIASLDQVYEIVEGETIDFTFAARRSIKEVLTLSDFQVTADFEKLSDVNAVTIEISCPLYEDDVTITQGLYQVMKVNLEELVEQNFKVTVVTEGEPAEGYFVGKKTAGTIVRVSGPKSKIERISEIVTKVDVSEVSGSFRTIAQPIALDEDGEVIDPSNLTFSEDLVTINIDIYKTKTINLLITASGEPAAGYEMTNVEYEPKTIEVAGEDDALNRIKYLSITEDINGARDNINKEINLQEQLQDDLVLVGEDQTAVINITIEKKEKKDLTYQSSDIEVRNKSSLFTLNYMTTGIITVTVEGPPSVLDDFTRSSFTPYIDLINYTSGTYSLIIKGDLPKHISIVNSPTVNLRLMGIDTMDQ